MSDEELVREAALKLEEKHFSLRIMVPQSPQEMPLVVLLQHRVQVMRLLARPGWHKVIANYLGLNPMGEFTLQVLESLWQLTEGDKTKPPVSAESVQLAMNL